MTLDTTGVQYYASSADGQLRCSSLGIYFSSSSPRDSVRFDKAGNWCRFSPDGKTISWDDQNSGLMVAPVSPSAASQRRRIAATGANEARWSRDGKELIYRQGNEWWAVPVQPTPGGKLPTPRLVLRGTYNQAYASWELAPDGRLLLLQGIPPVKMQHLNVITNFQRFVNQKLSGASK